MVAVGVGNDNRVGRAFQRPRTGADLLFRSFILLISMAHWRDTRSIFKMKRTL